MSYYLAVKNRAGKYRHHKVCRNVYIYVKQLEAHIKNPEKSKLLEAYPERFKNAK